MNTQFNEKEIKVINKGIKHWKKMIKYAEQLQEYGQEGPPYKMYSHIGTEWYVGFDPMCQYCFKCAGIKYDDETSTSTPCRYCPYKKKYKRDCFQLWNKLDEANTIEDWLKYAKKILNKIEGLL